MDLTDFNQYVADEGMLAGKLQYLSEGLEDILAVFVEGKFLGIELPNSIVLRIDETSPSIKGASVSARTKPAKFSTGLVVQVPEYIGVGEKNKDQHCDRRIYFQSMIIRADDIPEKEIQFSAMRASGPGGQHVNKTSNAVHLKFDISLPHCQEKSKMGCLGSKIQGLQLQVFWLSRLVPSAVKKNRGDALDRLDQLAAAQKEKKEKKKRAFVRFKEAAS